MKILLLLSESWNDKIYSNNNMTNWFTDFDNIEIRTISGSGIYPYNSICKDYFLISENQMLKSLFTGKKVGEIYNTESQNTFQNEQSETGNKKRFSCEFFRLCRDFVWRFGRYNYPLLKEFILDFKPDIIFSQRYGDVKMCRMEQIVGKIAKVPMVIYTGDDEFSLNLISYDPFFWIRRFWQRNCLKKQYPSYKLVYSQSKDQMNDLKKAFNSNTKFLVKCADFDINRVHTSVNDPIQIVYGGKFYCNRYKTLGQIANSIRKINKDANKIIMQLNIYTRDKVTSKQNLLLNDGVNSIIHGSVSATEMKEILSKADINLHVESFDKAQRLSTKYSFSTKVMDCLGSGCAVMAVCWEKHAAYQYLKENDAAICANSPKEIYDKLYEISRNPGIVLEYAKKAYDCGTLNHQRENIQKQIYDDFLKVIKECKN